MMKCLSVVVVGLVLIYGMGYLIHEFQLWDRDAHPMWIGLPTFIFSILLWLVGWLATAMGVLVAIHKIFERMV